MPNWCYTVSCFRGKPENINRLYNDICNAIEYQRTNEKYVLNLTYFFSLQNFDVESYRNKFTSWYTKPNFRGSIFFHFPKIVEENRYAYIYPNFETAWYMDFNVLHLICKIYDVEFSAYAEEPSMEVYEKGKNCDMETYDFDIAISPDWEQLEQKELDGEELTLVGNNDDDDLNDTIEFLKENNIDFEKYEILDNVGPSFYGVYYGPPIPGVHYDTSE